MIPALALSLFLSQAPSDAPLAVPEDPVSLEQGKPAPFPGVLVTDERFLSVTQRVLSREAKVKVYEATPPVPVVVVVAVVSAVVAGAAAAGITYAATRPKQ